MKYILKHGADLKAFDIEMKKNITPNNRVKSRLKFFSLLVTLAEEFQLGYEIIVHIEQSSVVVSIRSENVEEKLCLKDTVRNDYSTYIEHLRANVFESDNKMKIIIPLKSSWYS